MKNLLKLTILFLVGFVSCQKYVPAVEVEVDDTYVTVGFNTMYEGISLVEEMPLTKASEPNGLYGVRVIQCVGDKSAQAYGSKYCYGIFDDISLLQIQFKRNERYAIMMDYFPNGKNEIPYLTNEYSPLQVMPHHAASPATLNTIVYSNYFELAYICKDYGNKICDRYCYWNENFIPTENASIPINLLRMNAGLVFNLNISEGQEYDKVIVKINDKQYSANLSNGETQIVVDKVMLDMNNYDGTIPDLFYMDCIIGTPDKPTLFYEGQVEIKRNTIRTYSVRVDADIIMNSVSVTHETGDFKQDNGGYLN